MFLTEDDKQLELRKNEYLLMKKCSKCGGKGTYLTEKNMSAMCECRKTARRNVRLLDWGFPRKFLQEQWTMEMLKDKPFYPQLQKYIDNFETNFENGRGIYFYGPQGRGKTTCECAVGKEISLKINPYTFEARQNYTIGFMMFDDVIHKLLDKEPYLNKFLFKSDLLIIDNVGTETGKQNGVYSQRQLEMILRKRNNDCRPTIISSNYNIEEIGKEYNMDIHDFIIQNNDIIYVSGDNYRTIVNEEDGGF